MTELAGHRALVTGAARGIGRAIAARLAAEGAQLVLCDVLDTALDETAQSLPGALALPADVRNSALVEDWLDEHDAWPDILVNNAAIAPRTRVLDIDEQLLLETYAINAAAGVVLARMIAGRLIAASGRGSIVNVASVNAYRGHPELLHYNMSKAAMLSATRTLAAEWGRQGVRVNAVCPGSTRTDIWDEGGFDSAVQREYADKAPLGRFAEPAEIAEAVCFLASERSAFVTGAELVVDGGLMVNLP